MIVEEHPCVSTILQEQGWVCDSLHPRTVLETRMQHIAGSIRSAEYAFVWIRIPGKVTVPRDKRTHFNAVINSWLTAALNSHTFGIHCARSWDKSDKWASPESWSAHYGDAYLANKHISEHHLCAFNLTSPTGDGKEGPSGIVYRMLSTFEIPSTPCQSVGAVHGYDPPGNREGNASYRLEQEKTFLRALFEQLLKRGTPLLSASDAVSTRVSHPSQSGSLLRGPGHHGIYTNCQTRKPDSYNNKTDASATNTVDLVDGEGGTCIGCKTLRDRSRGETQQQFPTESAIKSKEHKKALKEKGLTPKRKPRIVEEHYDRSW